MRKIKKTNAASIPDELHIWRENRAVCRFFDYVKEETG